MIALLASDHGDNVEGGIAVSVGGLVIGAILALVIYLIADYLAQREGQPIIKTIGVVIALIVFLVLGFDISTE